MSALAWLFGLGMLVAVFPFLFHLIRRSPRERVSFSSLMFLQPSPPRLTRRSRLDNLLLLALRVLAIGLIAAAFMRPFFRSNIETAFAQANGEKVAILLDTSASMKRGDLWQQALDEAREVVNGLNANDRVAVYTFDSQLTNVRPFGETIGSGNFAQQFNLADVTPTWRPSDLGSAMVGVADELDQSHEESDTDANLQMVVISDMQVGSSISALQNFQWPVDVKVNFRRVQPASAGNASLRLLPPDELEPDSNQQLVMVRNSQDAQADLFEVAWANSRGENADLDSASAPRPVSFVVPPGTTKILPVPRPATPGDHDQLTLSGDETEFDNQFFAASPLAPSYQLAWLGEDNENDPNGSLYYFQRALQSNVPVGLTIKQFPPSQPFDLGGDNNVNSVPQWIVINRAVDDVEQNAINKLIGLGTTLLIVLDHIEMETSTAQWTGVKSLSKPEQAGDSYSMLEQLDFEHALLRPFAGSRLNDFTQIKIWQHLNANLADGTEGDSNKVIARFDDQTPAIWHHSFAEGNTNIFVMAFGWRPDHSQLALSTKFPVLLDRVLELASREPEIDGRQIVGQGVDLPDGYDLVWIDGKAIEIADSQSLAKTIDQPGVYRFTNRTDSQAPEIRVAFNVAESESNTAEMPLEQITAFDVQTGQHEDAATIAQRQRVLHDIELESKQKLWKWLILAGIAILFAETWLAGRTDRWQNRESNQQLEVAA